MNHLSIHLANLLSIAQSSIMKPKSHPLIIWPLAGIAFLLCPKLNSVPKVEKNLSYGPHERQVMDVYWDSGYENAPIVFTIHGGGFKKGDKVYCNADMRKLYAGKGCIVVSPNYRLVGKGEPITKDDCALDAAMAVAYLQANAKRFGGDPKRILSTGSSAGGYISAWIAYRKNWDWPSYARHKPRKLNIVGWFGDSPFLPPDLISQVGPGDPPGFVLYGGKREHPATPASQGHDVQSALRKSKVWSKMVYVDFLGHVPAKRILFSPQTRDRETHQAYLQFLDMVCHGKGNPKAGELIEVAGR